MKRIPLTLAAAAIVVALAGCGSSPEETPGAEHGTPGSSNSASSSPSAHSGHQQPEQDQPAGEEHNAADAMFATMMIPHHEQAVMMSGMMLEKESISPKIRELAEQIKAAQGPEIQRMSDWLKIWGEPVPVGGHGMGHDMGGGESGDGQAMDGMLSAKHLEELKAAQETEAERLFLKQMIEHHKGAIAMAQQEAEQGSNPAAVELAEDIVSAQKAEIEKMQQLLETL